MSPRSRLVLSVALGVAACAFVVFAFTADLPLNDQCEPEGALAATRAVIPGVLHRQREAVVEQAAAERRLAEIVLEQERKKAQFCAEHPGLCRPIERDSRAWPNAPSLPRRPKEPLRRLDAERLRDSCREALGRPLAPAVLPALREP